MADLKILHCPTTVGGNPQGLSRAEKALGYDSHSLTVTQNYLNYPADEVLIPDGKLSLKSEFKVFLKAIESLFKFNVIHYNFGQSLSPQKRYPKTQKLARWKVFLYSDLYASLFQLWDVKMAKFLGKVIAVTYQGSDARQVEYCRTHYPIHFYHESATDHYDSIDDSLKQQRIKVFEKNADIIYAVNPDLLNVLPQSAQFIPYSSVDPREWTPNYPDEKIDVPHIVHAPSNRDIKGTRYLLDAFERLEKEKIPFRYSLVENTPHNEAMEIYKTADLLVDQVLAGYYGGLAVELMALGKPVVCYLRDEDMKHLPDGMYEAMPIINATPDTLYDVLKLWLTENKGQLQECGRRSRAYVEAWHDPRKIAQRTIEDYKKVISKKRKIKN